MKKKKKKGDIVIKADYYLNKEDMSNYQNNNNYYNSNHNDNINNNQNYNQIHSSNSKEQLNNIQNKMNSYQHLSKNEKLKIIQQLENEIKQLKLIYEEEKKKKKRYEKQNYNQNNGLDQIYEIPENQINNYYINEKSVKIPDRISAKKKRNKNESFKIQKYPQKNNQNIIEKDFSEIKKGESIPYIFKLFKMDKDENWPEGTVFFCIPDNSEIYFNHIKLNDKLNVKQEGNIFEISIKIKFKNYKKIKPNEYSLNAKVICDSNENIYTNPEKIIVKVVKKKKNSNKHEKEGILYEDY